MKTALRATAVALSLSLVSLAASAASDGAFFRLEGGQARYDVDHTRYDGKSARAFGVGGGYRWQVSTPFALGVEAGYMDLGKIRDRFDGVVIRPNRKTQAATARSEFGTRAFMLGANGRWQMAGKWSLTGRFGVAHTRSRLWTSVDVGSRTESFRASAARNTAYAGLGVSYAVSSKVDLGLNMTHYSSTGSGLALDERENVNAFGISAEVRL